MTTWINLEGIMLSEINQIRKDLYIEAKKAELVESESRMMVTEGWVEGV